MKKSQSIFQPLSVFINLLYPGSRIKLIRYDSQEVILVANSFEEIKKIPEELKAKNVIRYGQDDHCIVYELAK